MTSMQSKVLNSDKSNKNNWHVNGKQDYFFFFQIRDHVKVLTIHTEHNLYKKKHKPNAASTNHYPLLTQIMPTPSLNELQLYLIPAWIPRRQSTNNFKRLP